MNQKPVRPLGTVDDQHVIELLSNLEFQPSARYRRAEATFPWKQGADTMSTTILNRRQPRLRPLIAITLVALVLALLVTPPLRTSAAELLHRLGLLTITHDPTSAQRFLETPPAPPTHPNATAAPPQPAVPAKEYTPAHVPAGYRHQDGPVGPVYVHAEDTQGVADGARYFRIYALAPGTDTANFAAGDGKVASVTVRGLPGIFVKQAPLYIDVPEGGKATWEELSVARVNLLMWQENGKTVAVESNALALEELLKVAESLTR